MTAEPSTTAGPDAAGNADAPAAAAPGAAAGAARPVDSTIESLTFDDAFAELRAVVAELEAGGLALEETIARTERAVALQRHCEQLLGAAELRVRQLISRPGGDLEARDIAADEASEA
ncbi:MAG: exodeoxyribonuclease VII small subunit [Chloroflexi bacterium]|nr:exodeoxyribonuclease VII small subunit [Chloroflexota bacterium]